MTTSNQLDAWVDALARELDLDLPQVDVTALLDVAREAAHSVTRPAAPLATFLVGYASGLRADSSEAFAAAIETATRLARQWVEEERN